MRSRSTQLALDVLAWRPFAGLLRSAAFPTALQALALLALLGLAAVGFGIGRGAADAELLVLRKTNLATLVVWGLWWPAMIVVALALGRAWCTVCPLELLSHLGELCGRRVPWRRLGLGRFLRAGSLVVIAYLILQLLVAGFSMHRVPHATSLLLLALILLAFGVGLVFREPRTFCRAFCPAAALLSAYGRFTPLQLETREAAVCAACTTRECVRRELRDRFDARSCPSLLRPFDRRAGDGCQICLQCAKVCPQANIGWGLVARAAPMRQRTLLRPFEAAFVMVALGFVTHELAGEVKWLDARFHAWPQAWSDHLPALDPGWLEALWFLLLFPAAIWTIIALTSRVLGHRERLPALLLGAASGALPFVALGHLAKATAKLSAWAGYLPLALHEPGGQATAAALRAGALGAPTPWVGLSAVGLAALALMAVVVWRAWRWSRQLPAGSLMAARAGLVGGALLFASILAAWALPSS